MDFIYVMGVDMTKIRASCYRSIKVALWLLAGMTVSVIAGEHERSKPSIESLYGPYSELLQDYVKEKVLESGGLVSAFRYREASSDPRTADLLQRQRAMLSAFDPGMLQEKYEAIAFWLNAYNFFMIAHILDEQPDGEIVESVWDYGGRYNPFQSSIFERKLFSVGERRYSLDEIEKEILLGDEYRRKGWKEARAHFAVNCASVGCPPLRRELYTPGNVDKLMSENTRRALRTDRHMRIKDDAVWLSEIFDWYEKDYIEEAGSVRKFIKMYTDDERHGPIEEARIRYISYDWRLNKPSNFSEFR